SRPAPTCWRSWPGIDTMGALHAPYQIRHCPGAFPMLDLKYLLANIEAVKENCRNRNMPADIVDEVDRVAVLEGERKRLLQAVEEVRRRQNEVAQATGKEKDPAKRAELVAEGKRLKAEAGQNEERLRQLETEVHLRLGRIPNLTHPDAPVGTTEEA